MTEKEINQEFTRKIEKGIFKPVARHLTNLAEAEDRLQDAICQVWWMFRRYVVEKDKILDDAVLTQKCKWSACDLARSFVPAQRRRRKGDVLDPRTYRDGKVQVLRLDGVVDDEREGDRALEIGLAEEMATSPERRMNSALDLQEWVGGLAHHDQSLMAMTMAGHELTRTAHELDLPYPRAYRRQQQLGVELARRAGVRINDDQSRSYRRRATHLRGETHGTV